MSAATTDHGPVAEIDNGSAAATIDHGPVAEIDKLLMFCKCLNLTVYFDAYLITFKW